MAATFALIEYNGASPGTQSVATNLNFGSTDAANQNAYAFVVRVGQNSYEKWLKARFTSDGTTTTILDCRFFHSAGTLPANVTLHSGVTAAYVAPTAQTSTVAANAMPTSYAGATPNAVFDTSITLGANGSQIQSDNFVVVQLRTTASAAAGKVPVSGSLTFTIQYDEY